MDGVEEIVNELSGIPVNLPSDYSYRIRWSRYDLQQTNWEPYSALQNCIEKVIEFWHARGLQDAKKLPLSTSLDLSPPSSPTANHPFQQGIK